MPAWWFLGCGSFGGFRVHDPWLFTDEATSGTRGALICAVCVCVPAERAGAGRRRECDPCRRPGVETPARTRAGVLPPLTAGRLGTPLPPLGCSSHRKRQAAWPALCLACAGAPPRWNRQLRESQVTPQSKAFKGAFSTASPALAVSGFAVRLWPGRLTLRSVVMLFGIILFSLSRMAWFNVTDYSECKSVFSCSSSACEEEERQQTHAVEAL